MDVSVKDQERIALGNRLALWTASIIRLAIRYRVPITIESLMTSRLWILPPIAKEVSRATSDCIRRLSVRYTLEEEY